MEINEKTLFQILQKLRKSEILEYLKSSYYEMEDKQRRNVYLDLYNEKVNKGLKSQELYTRVLTFHEKSIKGDYYAPFNINSKNYRYIPNETDEWFTELSFYLDETSKLVKKKEYKIANDCFERLYDLISKMEDGEEIIFADEYGTWMISTKLDYDNAYISSLSKTENENNFTERVLPLLIRDSYESLSSKIYSKIKKAANTKQLKKVELKIKQKDIRIK